jgi:RNA polymerase subunit RPABC4/transcription elongation factor Spt4
VDRQRIEQSISNKEQEKMNQTNLKPCPDCGREVSKEAAACPSCGRKLNQVFALWVILGLIIGVAGMAAILALGFVLMNL